jgi:hypothetical protein
MRAWRGTTIAGVASLHTLFALVVASGVVLPPEVLAEIGGAPLLAMRPGFGSADPPNLAALTFFWSISFGLALVGVGLLVREVEGRGQPVPRAVGGLLLAMAAVGAVLVPVSGFWLLLPPAFSVARTG